MRCNLKATALLLSVMMILSCVSGCGSAAQSMAATEDISTVSAPEAPMQEASAE